MSLGLTFQPMDLFIESTVPHHIADLQIFFIYIVQSSDHGPPSPVPFCRNFWTKNEVINHSHPLIHLWKACLNPLVLRGGDWSDSLSPSCRNPPAPFLRWDDAAPHIARLGDIHHTGTLFCYVVTSKMMWHFRLLRVGEIWFWFSLFTMNEDSSLTCW